MEMHLHDASDIILMLHESSQTESCDHIMRIIDDDIEDQKSEKQKMEQEAQDYYDHEREQLRDDIQYEENAATDRIIEAFGGLFHDGEDDSVASDRFEEDNTEYYVHSINSSEDDINENTDTEDGADEFLELISANTRLISFIAKQRETLDRLRRRITRMKRYIARLTFRMDELTARRHHEQPVQLDSGDTASVLMDAETDASLLVKPAIGINVEMNLFNNAEVKKEIERKLNSMHETKASDLWMYFDSGASRSVISTTSSIRKHLKEIVPAYGSCSVGNGTPLQYIETGKVKDNMEIIVVADLKYDLSSSVNPAKQSLTSVIDYDMKTGQNNSYTVDKITGEVTPLIERGRGILELPLHMMVPRGTCLSLTSPAATQQAALSPNVVSMFWHFYDDESFDPAIKENNQTKA
jgi:hypothetical protein